MPPALLNNYLEKQKVEKSLAELLVAISRAGKFVAHAIRTGDLGFAGTSNLFGENQLALDVLSDQIFTKHLKASGLVSKISSEEKGKEEAISENGKYCVAFDPLDGSSLIDTNLTVGAIFGIFEGDNFLGRTGNEMVASCYLVFGPRITFVTTVKDQVAEFTMNELGEFVVTHEDLKVKSDAKTYAPGNLLSCQENPKYKKLSEYWIDNLKLRYSGGMVPDIHSIFAKQGGIFSYPSIGSHPNGKLRLLFECAPFAYLVVKGGGTAKDENGTDILDLEIEEVHQRTTIFIGSKNEVDRSIKYMNE